MNDATSVKTLNFPAAAGTATSTALDIKGGELPATGGTGAVTAAVRAARVELVYEVPTLAALTNTSHSYAISLTHCDTTGGTYTALSGTLHTVVGVASTGPLAHTKVLILPPDTQRFVKVQIVATATTGDNTAQTLTVRLKDAA